MSSVSKYANLPGIASDQPDIYETNDLPEVDQRKNTPPSLYDAVEVTDNVDIIDVTVGEAYERFRDRVVDGKDVDFRQPIGLRRHNYGYQTWGEWEAVGGQMRHDETPLQRYNRLQAEINEFVSSVRQMKDATNENSQDDNLTGNLTKVMLAQNLEQLSGSLNEINLEDWAEFDVLKGIDERRDQLIASVANQMEEAKRVDDKQTTRQESDSCLTYELLYKPEHGRLAELSKLNLLEQRIRRLESLLGSDEQKCTFLASLTNNKSLMEIAAWMSQRVTQLDANHLEQIDGRITSLLQKFSQMADKKEQIEETEKHNKVSELYELVANTDKQRSSLPSIVSRMNTLYELQQQAVQFCGSLSYMDELQIQTNETLKQSETDIVMLKKTFDTNIDSIKLALESIDKRINSLQ